MKSQVYAIRKNIILYIIFFTGLVFIIRLFILQIPDNAYKFSAENNVLRYIIQYPARGLIYDRNGTLLVYNEAAYDLLVIPRQVQAFDTMELCRILDIEKEDLVARLQNARKYSMYKPSIFMEQVSKEDYAFLEEKLFKYPGFYVQARTLRKYPLPIAAHTLGYVGEVTRGEVDKSSYYKSGDYTGKSGIEKFYEDSLRGRKGMKLKIVDVFNREKGSFRDGQFDTVAVMGTNLTITLDATLQEYGEALMNNKKGSIVAIEPATGEILVLVTSPSYDPNLLVGRVRSENYTKLSVDSLKPLMNRAIMGTYSPGSTFKLVNALIGLQERTLFPSTEYHCDGPGSRPIKCTHYHITPLALNDAIQNSCNPYFWNVFRSIIYSQENQDVVKGYQTWYDHVISLGFGRKFNTDIPFELSGSIPEYSLYNKIYGEGHWNALTVRTLAIGQGEILVTPMQMANFVTIVANRGFFYPPHILRAYGNGDDQYPLQVEKRDSDIDPQHWEIIVNAMLDVVEGESGTARWYKLDSIPFCGKTGTVENPHGKDHSMFIAFAPKDNPKIAMSVIVENAGYGATWAAPMASLLIEKYMTGTVKRTWLENRMLNSNLIATEEKGKEEE
jgi:penicillin-binding protein 2